MKKTYDASNTHSIADAKIAIVQATWHKDISDRMVEASKEILEAAQCASVEVFEVPGTYEIPLVSKKLARSGKYEAIIVYGIVVKGDTDHYEVLLQTVIRECGKVMYDFEVPIIMEVLPVHNLEHAISRSQGDSNKGIEAAQATIDIVRLNRKLLEEQLS